MTDGKPKQDQAATSAYAMDGRDNWRKTDAPASGWHPTFDRLLGSGHIFMGQTYAAAGLLFRGLPSGLANAVEQHGFWQSDADNPLCNLERELGIIFCSEVARDALAVARPWEDNATDAMVLIFAATEFRRRWQARAAATLGFADIGMVFKYPCLAEALDWQQLYGLVVHPSMRPACEAMINQLNAASRPYIGAPVAADVAERDAWQAAVDELLRRDNESAAEAEATSDYPRRGS